MPRPGSTLKRFLRQVDVAVGFLGLTPDLNLSLNLSLDTRLKMW
jgi:hypothetical protein